MRTIAILCVLLLTNTLMGQDANTLLPASFTTGPAIESGAFRAKYEEAQAQIEVQKRLIADLRKCIKDLEKKCSERCQCDAGGTACPCVNCNCGKAKAEKRAETPAQATVKVGRSTYWGPVIEEIPANQPLRSDQYRIEQPAAPAQFKITMVSKDNCPACPPAKAYLEPRYKATGWDWSDRVDRPSRPDMSYPYYEVCLGDSCKTIQCRPDQLDNAIRNLIAQREQKPAYDKRGRFLGNW